jgi:tripartite-type tricarboxylate transporter receptor subunit TctC
MHTQSGAGARRGRGAGRTALGLVGIVTLVLAALVAAAPAQDASGAAFYRGKTVTLIVATKPGGGYDAYARLVARYLTKYLPARTIVVRNLPGAGHIIGANEVYNARPDGLTLGTFNKGLIVAQIAGTRGIRFDMTKFTWIGVPDSEPRVWIVSKQSPFRTLGDVTAGTRTLTEAANGVGSEDYVDAMMLRNILGLTTLKIVTGYQGNDADLAMLRGEVDGLIGSLSSLEQLMQTEGARPILVIGKARLPGYPDVPVLPEVAPAGKTPLVTLMLSQAVLGHPFAAPPGVPADRVQALRRAFAGTLRDPELQAAAKKARLIINPLDGEETARLVTEAAHPPQDVAGVIKSIMAATKKR